MRQPVKAPSFFASSLTGKAKSLKQRRFPAMNGRRTGTLPKTRFYATRPSKRVKQWEYNPYLVNGQPVEVENRVIVKFKTEPIDHAEGGVIGGVPRGVIGGIIGNAAPPPRVLQPPHLRVSSKVMEGNLLKHVDPVYLAMARVAKIQGEVRLQAGISKTGVIQNLRAISGHPILIQAAMDAVRQWKYKPFLLDGEPIEAEGVVIVDFEL